MARVTRPRPAPASQPAHHAPATVHMPYLLRRRTPGSSLRPVVLLAVLVSLFAANPLQAQKKHAERPLTLYDVNAGLAELAGNSPLDYIASSRIGYGVTGQGSYDTFFRNAAIAYGGVYYGQRLVTEATDQLKRFARSKAAVAEMRSQVRELTNDADTTEWTAEQSLAVLKAAKKRNQLSRDETLYFFAMSALLVATVPVVKASVEAAPTLLRTGRDLTRRIPDDFDIFEAPQMAFSVNRSVKQLAALPQEGASLVESLVVLSRGFQLLGSE